MKILPVAAQLFHADIRTEMKKLTFPFRNFANVPKPRISYVNQKLRGFNSSQLAT